MGEVGEGRVFYFFEINQLLNSENHFTTKYFIVDTLYNPKCRCKKERNFNNK